MQRSDRRAGGSRRCATTSVHQRKRAHARKPMLHCALARPQPYLQGLAVHVGAPEGAGHGVDAHRLEQAGVGHVGAVAQVHHGAAAVAGDDRVGGQLADDLHLGARKCKGGQCKQGSGTKGCPEMRRGRALESLHSEMHRVRLAAMPWVYRPPRGLPPTAPRTLNLFSWNMDSASSRDTSMRSKDCFSLTACRGSGEQGGQL